MLPTRGFLKLIMLRPSSQSIFMLALLFQRFDPMIFGVDLMKALKSIANCQIGKALFDPILRHAFLGMSLFDPILSVFSIFYKLSFIVPKIMIWLHGNFSKVDIASSKPPGANK